MRTRVRNHALAANVAASSRNAQPAPTPSTSAVASAGPTSSAKFTVRFESACASWISSSGMVRGKSPIWAGRKNASDVPNSASITTRCQISTWSVKIRIASSACSVIRATSVVIISRARGRRSAHTPPIRRNVTSGSICAASTMPTSVALPVRSVTNSAMATTTMLSPITLVLDASHRLRKAGWRRTRRRSLIAANHYRTGR